MEIWITIAALTLLALAFHMGEQSAKSDAVRFGELEHKGRTYSVIHDDKYSVYKQAYEQSLRK